MNLLKNRGVALVVLHLIVTFYLASYIYEELVQNNSQLSVVHVMIAVMVFLGWIQLVTWGTDIKVQKDELGKQIKYKSSKISYDIMTVVLLALYLIDLNYYQKDDGFGNVFLLIALGISVLLNPIIQFILALRYK
ncbi:hypothetical protein [Bacillus sp. B-jedd]|uniref:hypothetical protein n=1 Tax=Bacillus sp. B-jedd TaxID=1476857 RepID=UPI0005155C74|nr:hypothetical protein [Bacillus sp. B-jedd]CEG27157.1 group-specific protein [Bacillus sp. B-jedd]